MLDATKRLLEEHGRGFGLRDVAARARVSSATAYRHFASVKELIDDFHLARIKSLAERLDLIAQRQRGIDLFAEVCNCWVGHVLPDAHALKHARQTDGFVDSVRRNMPVTSALYSSLSGVLAMLIRDGVIPDQDPEYAVLLWITLFDERVLVDLQASYEFSSDRIASVLGASVLAAWRATPVVGRTRGARWGEERV